MSILGRRQSHYRWSSGNALRLLENGEEYFPRVFEAIRRAEREVLIETFLWFEDEVGSALQRVLLEAAGRGVSIDVTVDGYGTPGLSEGFLRPLAERGVRIFTFDPRPTWFGLRVNPLCRLHRKIVVIDSELAFLGGINFSDEHNRTRGRESKQDYAVEVRGAVVRTIEHFCHVASEEKGLPRRRRYWLRRAPRALTRPRPGAQALLVTRDNAEHPTDIETAYRAAFRKAQHRITLANAYFFPGYRFLRDLKRAAERGVDVRLVLQGRPDKGYVQSATETLYDTLLSSGIRVYRYTERVLHAKVAVVDGIWATVGSSNLDPTSFALNLEANLVVRDEGFASELERSLERLIAEGCEELRADQVEPAGPWRRLWRLILYHVGRRFGRWGRLFPLSSQGVRQLSAAGTRRP